VREEIMEMGTGTTMATTRETTTKAMALMMRKREIEGSRWVGDGIWGELREETLMVGITDWGLQDGNRHGW
jgi:hypothetical protein